MAKIFSIVIVFLGLVVGAGAGIFLRPEPLKIEGCPENDYATCDGLADDAGRDVQSEPDPNNVYYVKLSKQFVIPVVKDGRGSSIFVMSLSIETTPVVGDVVFEREPKLRDALLSVMFLHANSGGSDGQFTARETMKDLRGSLLEVTRDVIGDDIYSVLVTDILRQDI